MSIAQLNIREMNAQHIENFEELFTKSLYGKSGNISIGPLGLDETETHNLLKIESGEISKHKGLVIDGQHRLEAIRRSLPSSLSDSNIQLKLWVRNDGKTIDDAERIELGRFLNSMSSTVRPHSLVDNIHTCSSYARAQRARNARVGSKEVTASSLAHSICDVQLLGKKEWGQCSRFASVALGFERHPFAYDEFRRMPGISNVGISHICNSEMWKSKMSAGCQSVYLEE